jgi:hypothetical protein
MVRRMNPSLVCRVDRSHSVTAAYSSSSLATVASDWGVDPQPAPPEPSRQPSGR